MESSYYNNRDIIFRARLTPYRSLGPRGFILLMSFIGGLSFIAGLVFFWIGAWPIIGFFGLDVILIWWAFRFNYRSARQCELIYITPYEVIIHHISSRGKVNKASFNPYWVRLNVEELDDEGTLRLLLTSHGRSYEIGTFLNPPERIPFSKALEQALMVARMSPHSL